MQTDFDLENVEVQIQQQQQQKEKNNFFGIETCNEPFFFYFIY